eukprot:3936466-Rhodomonas_salina.1
MPRWRLEVGEGAGAEGKLMAELRENPLMPLIALANLTEISPQTPPRVLRILFSLIAARQPPRGPPPQTCFMSLFAMLEREEPRRLNAKRCGAEAGVRWGRQVARRHGVCLRLPDLDLLPAPCPLLHPRHRP